MVFVMLPLFVPRTIDPLPDEYADAVLVLRFILLKNPNFFFLLQLLSFAFSSSACSLATLLSSAAFSLANLSSSMAASFALIFSSSACSFAFLFFLCLLLSSFFGFPFSSLTRSFRVEPLLSLLKNE